MSASRVARADRSARQKARGERSNEGASGNRTEVVCTRVWRRLEHRSGRGREGGQGGRTRGRARGRGRLCGIRGRPSRARGSRTAPRTGPNSRPRRPRSPPASPGALRPRGAPTLLAMRQLPLHSTQPTHYAMQCSALEHVHELHEAGVRVRVLRVRCQRVGADRAAQSRARWRRLASLDRNAHQHQNQEAMETRASGRSAGTGESLARVVAAGNRQVQVQS